MDTLIALKRKEFEKAMENLKGALALPYSDIVRDSVLLRFELASELSWKTLKAYLESRLQVQSAYPTTVYRDATKAHLLTPDVVEVLLAMVADRNRMVHDYNQEWSDALYQRVARQYVKALEVVLAAVSK